MVYSHRSKIAKVQRHKDLRLRVRQDLQDKKKKTRNLKNLGVILC